MIIAMLAAYAALYIIATLMRGWRSLSAYALIGAALIVWNFFTMQDTMTAPGPLQEDFLWRQAIIWMSALGLLAGVSIKAILLQNPALSRQNRLTLMACGLFLPVLIGGGVAILT